MSAILSVWHSLLLQTVVKSSSHRSAATGRRRNDGERLSPFACLKRATPTEMENLNQDYQLDSSPRKMNLAHEVYRNEVGKAQTFQAVKKAEISIACNDFNSSEPLPPLGNPDFLHAATEMVLGKSSPAQAVGRVVGIQTKNSIDALALAAQFLRHKTTRDVCLLARPCNPIYWQIFKEAGFNCQRYQYYSDARGELNIYGLVADLMTSPDGAVVVLDACSQHPTGQDPSVDEWKLLFHIVKCKKMLPLIHLDSPGLASGDPNEDAWPVRFFSDCGIDVLCAQSFVKNFGLYNETVGHLMVVLSNVAQVHAFRGQFESMLLDKNAECSSVHSSRIVAKILTDEKLRSEWCQTLKDMHQRVSRMRGEIRKKLAELKTPGNWQNLVKQNGYHLYWNPSRSQIRQLKDRHIYVPSSGRMNLTSVSPTNLDSLAAALNDVMQATKGDVSSDNYFVADKFNTQYFHSV
ncbi:aspartate aminotransferase, cytoplasmic-like [Drosophila pseudoobscura]|uniref:aspartate transaminase n=1 Tax=Drosophila pseudoobscura pseudoobscura TaxID=46245 RepID=A0A6I8UXR1_DROPS|nr:aspartate aminotransferase, cytoplasmic [Drosophila pseudoobscura]